MKARRTSKAERRAAKAQMFEFRKRTLRIARAADVPYWLLDPQRKGGWSVNWNVRKLDRAIQHYRGMLTEYQKLIIERRADKVAEAITRAQTPEFQAKYRVEWRPQDEQNGSV